MLEQVKIWFESLAHLVGELGYLGVFLLMTIESSFIPFPSEIVLIPAGYAVKQGQMNGVIVLLAGTLGSLTGALINYFLAMKLGRAAVLKYGKYFFITTEKFEIVEKQFLTHGAFVTFVCRLIFGVRQLISIPAGIARMKLAPFCIYTSLGAGIWSAILISLGYVLGTGDDAISTAKTLGYWLLPVLLILSLAYYYWHCSGSKKQSTSS